MKSSILAYNGTAYNKLSKWKKVWCDIVDVRSEVIDLTLEDIPYDYESTLKYFYLRFLIVCDEKPDNTWYKRFEDFFMLRYEKGMTYEEIAEKKGVAKSTVRETLKKGLKKMMYQTTDKKGNRIPYQCVQVGFISALIKGYINRVDWDSNNFVEGVWVK